MKYSAAIDLGGTNIGVGIVGEDGTLISSSSVPVEDASCAEGLISQIAFAIRLGAQGADMKVSDLSFVGVGIPGICSGEKGPVLFAPNIFWRNIDLACILEEETGLPVFLANDADCAALGEYHFGAGKNFLSMLMLTLGTGVGGAIVSEGKLFKGFAAAAEKRAVLRLTVPPRRLSARPAKPQQRTRNPLYGKCAAATLAKWADAPPLTRRTWATLWARRWWNNIYPILQTEFQALSTCSGLKL